MSRRGHLVPIRRILVALDATAASYSALEAAAALASRMEAELLGLFVEDANLLRFAALPFAREVGLVSAQTRRLGSSDMERALRAQASRAQEALTAVAERRRVRCSFRVVRGEVTAQVLEAAHEVDLVAIGMRRRQAWRVSSTVREIVSAAPRPVLLLPPDAPIRAPVLAMYDGSTESAQALSVAQRLTQMNGGALTILIPGKAKRLQEEAAGLLEGSGLELRFRPLPDADAASLAQAAQAEAAGTLVLGASLRLKEEMLEELLERLDCAVILVR